MNATTETKTVRLGDGPAYFVPRGQLVGTLFGRGGTATGEYRALKGAIVFYTADGSPRVALITNKYGERFYVSARAVQRPHPLPIRAQRCGCRLGGSARRPDRPSRIRGEGRGATRPLNPRLRPPPRRPLAGAARVFDRAAW